MSKRLKIAIIASVIALVIIAAGVIGGVLANTVFMPDDGLVINESSSSPGYNTEFDRFIGASYAEPGKIPVVHMDSSNGRLQIFLHISGYVMLYASIQSVDDGQKIKIEYKSYYKINDKNFSQDIPWFNADIEFIASVGTSRTFCAKENSASGKFTRYAEREDITRVTVKIYCNSSAYGRAAEIRINY